MSDKETFTVNFQYYFQTKYIDHINAFLEEYAFDDIFLFPNRHTLKSKTDRVCRFCGRTNGETTFKNEAHLIPEMLGNDSLFSDSECDDCNNFFGKTYEDHLSKMLGIYRTINKVRSKKKYPVFKSPGEQITARVQPATEKNSVVISRNENADQAIKVDEERSTMTINFKKHPYIPVMAYNALLKIALSIIKENEVQRDYRLVLDYLLKKTDKVFGGCIVTGYALPFHYDIPAHAILYRKKNLEGKTHTHVMALYFQNMMFAVPVVGHKNDFFFYGQQQTIRTAPPIYLHKINLDNVVIKPFMYDLSSRDILKGEEDALFVEMNKEDYAQRVAFDTKTNKIDPGAVYDPNSIMKIIISDGIDPMNLNDISNILH